MKSIGTESLLEYAYFDSPIGSLKLCANDTHLLAVSFVQESLQCKSVSRILQKACDELNEYFYHKQRCFSLPYNLVGTEFQKAVWEALLSISYGQVLSYKDLAVKIRRQNAYRAVGVACSKNPLAIIVPCHRVISHSGNLGGYAGGLERKESLLRLEGFLT